MKKIFAVLAVVSCALPAGRASYKEAFGGCLFMYDSNTGIHHIMSIDGSAYMGNGSNDSIMDYVDEHC